MSGSSGSGIHAAHTILHGGQECYTATSILSVSLALAFVINSIATLLSTRYWPGVSSDHVSESIKRLLEDDAESETSVVDDGTGGTELAELPISNAQVDMDAIENASGASRS